jgi:hypothetical protein
MTYLFFCHIGASELWEVDEEEDGEGIGNR